jgi:hypothetical protein
MGSAKGVIDAATLHAWPARGQADGLQNAVVVGPRAHRPQRAVGREVLIS